MTVNPLVASRLDQPADPWAGVWIAEDIELIAQGVRDGSWIDGTLGVVGAGLDGLALLSDPVGVLLQYGGSWIIEHVRPLSEALDWLAGDPGHIAGNARTWRNVAASLAVQADDLGKTVRLDVSDWSGAAAAAYRDWTGQQQAAIAAMGRAAETMAAITEGAGFLIAAVRVLVRDAIATCVSRLAVYAAEELLSVGFATPLVVEQVTTTVAAWAAKIARLLRGLLASLRGLIPIIRRLGGLIGELKKILSRLRRPVADSSSLNRVKQRGAGPIQLFNVESVSSIAAKYGIDIADLDITLGDRRIRGVCGRTLPDGRIVLFPTGFRSEEDLARTLAHEKYHHDELVAGKPFPKTDAQFDLWEDRAYAFEDDWWNNQPIRPEPRK